MTRRAGPPAERPCGSCPYRCDVPSGVWDAAEYDKLVLYDQETFDQPVALFLCHRQDGRVCAGWAGVHGDLDSLALRLAASTGALTADEAEAVLDYQSPVPLFRTGAEAAEHGKAAIARPGPTARRMIGRLAAAAERRPDDDEPPF